MSTIDNELGYVRVQILVINSLNKEMRQITKTIERKRDKPQRVYPRTQMYVNQYNTCNWYF